MIVRSKIRQSFKHRGGFVLNRGDNVFPTPLPDRQARIINALAKAKLVTIIEDEASPREATPAAAAPRAEDGEPTLSASASANEGGADGGAGDGDEWTCPENVHRVEVPTEGRGGGGGGGGGVATTHDLRADDEAVGDDERSSAGSQPDAHRSSSRGSSKGRRQRAS